MNFMNLKNYTGHDNTYFFNDIYFAVNQIRVS